MSSYFWRKFTVIILIASLFGNGYLFFRLKNTQIAFNQAFDWAKVYQGLDLKHRQERDELKDALSISEERLKEKAAELKAKQAEVNQAAAQLAETKKQIEGLNGQLKNQENQLSANASELEKLRQRPPLFSFQNKSSRDVEVPKSDVQKTVTEAYDYIESIYGKPYLLHSVTISFVDNLTTANAAGEIVITNSDKGLDLEIKIIDFDKNNFASVNTIIHEIIHSFHGLATLEPIAYEEGITVAAADAVMEKMTKDRYIRISEQKYNSYNNDPAFSIPNSISAFYSSPKAAEFYQVTGYGWMKFYREDPNFFRRFNETYYKYIQEGRSSSKEMTLEVIKSLMPSVSGEPIEQYLTRSKAFNL